MALSDLFIAPETLPGGAYGYIQVRTRAEWGLELAARQPDACEHASWQVA
jgi:hypothetical protein